MSLYIVYATDDGYLMPTMVAVASALAWAEDASSVQIHVLDTGIVDAGWDNFEKSLRTHFGQAFGLKRHKIDQTLFSGFKTWHGSVGAYARLLMPDLIPDAGWCVYCDGDTLFTDDPLKLQQIFDAKFAIQGHADWQIPEMNHSRKKWFERNGLGWVPEQYVCSGFLLMNLGWFRKNDGAKRCLDFIRQHPDVVHPDQDALAYVCRGHIGVLPDGWGRFSWDAFRNGRPGCLHYASDLPWKLMTNKYRDYNDAHKLWFAYVSNLFITKTMLLLGYSFEDGDMRQLLQIVHNRLGRMSRPIYSIQVDARADEVARFRRRGVEVINLPAGRRSYGDTITEFLRQLKAYKDGETLKHVTSNVDESKAQLILPGNENQLCFVSCSIKRVALLKRLIDPIIRNKGAVPLWTDNIVPTDGMSLKNAIEAAIRKSSVRIFDVSEAGDSTLFELQMSLQDDESRTIIIKDGSVAEDRKICLADRQVIYYSDPSDSNPEKMCWGTVAIESTLASVLDQRIKIQDGNPLSEAARLFARGEYNATVVFAWTRIESALRKSGSVADGRLCPVTRRLMDMCAGDVKLQEEMFKFRNLRNRIVHGMAIKVSKKDAAASLETARKLIQKIAS